MLTYESAVLAWRGERERHYNQLLGIYQRRKNLTPEEVTSSVAEAMADWDQVRAAEFQRKGFPPPPAEPLPQPPAPPTPAPPTPAPEKGYQPKVVNRDHKPDLSRLNRSFTPIQPVLPKAELPRTIVIDPEPDHFVEPNKMVEPEPPKETEMPKTEQKYYARPSGYPLTAGVTWDGERCQWRVKCDGNTIGRFESDQFEAAVECRKNAVEASKAKRSPTPETLETIMAKAKVTMRVVGAIKGCDPTTARDILRAVAESLG